MKNTKKSSLIFMLVTLLIIAITTPTFAWYSQMGFLNTHIDNVIGSQQKSTFSLNYSLREIEAKEKVLLGAVPGANYGEEAPNDTTKFENNNAWYKINGQSEQMLSSLESLAGQDSEIVNAIVLKGIIGYGITSGDGSDSEQAIPSDPLAPSDNPITMVNAPMLLDDVDVESGESDNRFSLFGNFSAEEDKLCGVDIKITPKRENNVFDNAAVNAIRYAVYYEQKFDENGEAVVSTKTIFANNAFKYAYDEGNGIKTSVAVSQNGYFLAKRGCSYEITAIIWLDGLADVRAESGCYDVNIQISDFSNIITNQIDVDLENKQVVGFLPNSVPTENLEIPSVFYMYNADGEGEEIIITEICQDAFKNDTTLKTVTIPDSIETIGKNAFYGCSSIEVVKIGNGLKLIDENAFYGVTKLNSLIFANPYNWIIEEENRTPEITDLLSGVIVKKIS